MKKTECSSEILSGMAERLRLTYCRDHIDEILAATTNSKMNPREVLQYVFKHEIGIINLWSTSRLHGRLFYRATL